MLVLPTNVFWRQFEDADPADDLSSSLTASFRRVSAIVLSVDAVSRSTGRFQSSGLCGWLAVHFFGRGIGRSDHLLQIARARRDRNAPCGHVSRPGPGVGVVLGRARVRGNRDRHGPDGPSARAENVRGPRLRSPDHLPSIVCAPHSAPHRLVIVAASVLRQDERLLTNGPILRNDQLVPRETTNCVLEGRRGTMSQRHSAAKSRARRKATGSISPLPQASATRIAVFASRSRSNREEAPASRASPDREG